MREHIYKLCKQNASNKLSSSESKLLDEKREDAKNIKELLLMHLNLSFKTLQEYRDALIVLSKNLLEDKKIQKYELRKIFEAYLKYIIPFIIHFLSSTSAKESDIVEIQKHFTQHMIAIVDFYTKSLQQK